jgi:hypothetical protein
MLHWQTVPVSKMLGSYYRSGRVKHWLKIKNPNAPAVKREHEEDWGGRTSRRSPHGAIPPIY